MRPAKSGVRLELLRWRRSKDLDPLLSLWPAESDDKRTPGDRAAERGRDPKWQACLDCALDVVNELLSGIFAALKMGEGDARLAEDRPVTLHHQHDGQPRAGRAGRLPRHAHAELALEVDKRVGGRRTLSERDGNGADRRRKQCDHWPGARH